MKIITCEEKIAELVAKGRTENYIKSYMRGWNAVRLAKVKKKKKIKKVEK